MASETCRMEDLTIDLRKEIHVRASLSNTFEALLEQLGPYNEVEDGRPMPMKIEAWPGGRWYRDLGENDGHFWATVQAIKRPTLLELSGPLFMSSPTMSNLQYRLKEENGGTLISFRHWSFGIILAGYRNVENGWGHIHELVVKRAEARR
jgi:uncharacterized protein YndB with AHSA1/START domain